MRFTRQFVPALIVILALAGGMPIAVESAPGPSQPQLATRFLVTAGTGSTEMSLGSWAKITGLPLKAASSRPWFPPPGRTKYPNIKLTRAAGSESALVQAWLAHMAASGLPTSIRFELRDSSGNILQTWHLVGVLPVDWSIGIPKPSGKIATETLELSHTGFLVRP